MSPEKHIPVWRGALWRGRDTYYPWGDKQKDGRESRNGEAFPVVSPAEWLQRRWGQEVWALKARGFCQVLGGPGSWGYLVRFVFGKDCSGVCAEERVRREETVEPLAAESMSRPE